MGTKPKSGGCELNTEACQLLALTFGTRLGLTSKDVTQHDTLPSHTLDTKRKRVEPLPNPCGRYNEDNRDDE